MHLRHKLTGALALLAIAGSAQAGSLSDLGLSLEQIRSLNAQLTAPVVAPGISFGSPTGFGANWGQAYAGIGGDTTPPGSPKSVDGSMLVGAGFGDARNIAGVDVAMTVISLQDSFGSDGNFSAKVHHSFESLRSSLAIGIEDTGGWGFAKDRDSSTYASYTQVFDLSADTPKRPLSLVVTLGAGNERFTDPGKSGTGVFGAVALNWHRQSSVIADWTGRDLNAAISLVPLYRIPLVVTLGAINITQRFADTEFAGGIGYLYTF